MLVPLVALLAPAVIACGGDTGPRTGDVEGQVMAMRDASQPAALQAGVNVVLASTNVQQVAQTDAEGKYRFKDVPAADYGIAFSLPAKEGETAYQMEERQFSVSPGQVETISVVLLGEGIARPDVPPEMQRAAQSGQSVSAGSGLMGNPFFWYFMFNQPWLGGYTRPPVVVYGPDRTLTADTRQPQTSASGRPFSNYSPAGGAGTKAAPAVVPSKGVVRPGQSPALPSASDASRGAVRPGSQAPAASSGSGSSGSPPRVGAGSGSSAGRSPSSGSPPRVRVGRR